MLDRTAFTEAAEQSGLTKQELARVFEMSRQQVYNILHGSTPPEHRAQRINTYSRAMLKLIQLNVLPLPPAIKGQRRHDAITKLIKKLYELASPE